jgi:hypothetical protein
MIKRILVGLAGTTYTPVAIQRAITLVSASLLFSRPHASFTFLPLT